MAYLRQKHMFNNYLNRISNYVHMIVIVCLSCPFQRQNVRQNNIITTILKSLLIMLNSLNARVRDLNTSHFLCRGIEPTGYFDVVTNYLKIITISSYH